jgi:hypothetical protein
MMRWATLFLCLPSFAFAADYEVTEITSGLLPGTGTALNLGDDQSVSVDLPFAFTYFGTDYDDAWVSSNGFLSFSTSSNLCCNASEIDSSNTPRNTLFGLWGDPDPRRGETSLTGNPYTMTTTGTGGVSAFVTGWYGVPEYSTNNYFSFQIVLNADHSFEFRYGDVNTYQSTDSQYARNHSWLAGFTGPTSTDNELILYGHDMSSLSNSSFRAATPSSIDCMIFPSSPGCESVPDPVFEDDFNYEDDTFDFYSDGSDDGQFDGSDDGRFDTYTGEDTFVDDSTFLAANFSEEENMETMMFFEEDFSGSEDFVEEDFTLSEVFFEEQMETLEEADLREEIREEVEAVFEELFEELIEEEIFIEETVIFIEELEAEIVESVVEEAAAELLEEEKEVALGERLEVELLSPDEVAALVPSVSVSSGGNWSQTFGSSGVSGDAGGGMINSFAYGTDAYMAFSGGSDQTYGSDSSNAGTATSATAAVTNSTGAAATENNATNVSSPVGQAVQQEIVTELVIEPPVRQSVTTEFFQAAADQNNEVLGTEAQDIAVAELTAAPAGFDAYSLTTIPDRPQFYPPMEFYEDSIPVDDYLNLYRLLRANDQTYNAMMDDQYD